MTVAVPLNLTATETRLFSVCGYSPLPISTLENP